MKPELEKDLLELLAECVDTNYFNEYDKANAVEKLGKEIIEKHKVILPE